MVIHIKISESNNGQWGPDTSDQKVQVMARNAVTLAGAYARRRWPEAEVKTELTQDCVGEQVYGTPGDPIRELGVYLYRVPSAQLQSSDFDAEEYLETHTILGPD
jgi:hypothetical protein